jgi:hypothetical protein
MTGLHWGTSTSYVKVPATELLKQLPDSPGENRERMVRDFALRGDVPAYVQTWCPVSTRQGLHTGTFYCSPDFLSIGDDLDFVRARINGATAELIGRAIGAVLPTKKMVDLIYAASRKLSAQPWGAPYDRSMMATSRWRRQDKKVNEQASDAMYGRGELWEGHAKNVVVGAGLAAKRGENIGIYGWFDEKGKAIQGPTVNWGSHEWTYTDYSQCIRFIHKDMLVDGVTTSVSAVLQNKELAPLISDEGTLAHCTYLEFHPEWLE